MAVLHEMPHHFIRTGIIVYIEGIIRVVVDEAIQQNYGKGSGKIFF